jgi:hypothetical protein
MGDVNINLYAVLLELSIPTMASEMYSGIEVFSVTILFLFALQLSPVTDIKLICSLVRR